MNSIAEAIVKLAVIDHFKGDKEKSDKVKISLTAKFEKDLIKTYKELGFDSAKGMSLVELDLM